MTNFKTVTYVLTRSQSNKDASENKYCCSAGAMACDFTRSQHIGVYAVSTQKSLWGISANV